LSPAATGGRGNLNDVQANMEIAATADAGSGVQENCCIAASPIKRLFIGGIRYNFE